MILKKYILILLILLSTGRLEAQTLHVLLSAEGEESVQAVLSLNEIRALVREIGQNTGMEVRWYEDEAGLQSADFGKSDAVFVYFVGENSRPLPEIDENAVRLSLKVSDLQTDNRDKMPAFVLKHSFIPGKKESPVAAQKSLFLYAKGSVRLETEEENSCELGRKLAEILRKNRPGTLPSENWAEVLSELNGSCEIRTENRIKTNSGKWKPMQKD